MGIPRDVRMASCFYVFVTGLFQAGTRRNGRRFAAAGQGKCGSGPFLAPAECFLVSKPNFQSPKAVVE
jgi:hypothetical protein